MMKIVILALFKAVHFMCSFATLNVNKKKNSKIHYRNYLTLASEHEISRIIFDTPLGMGIVLLTPVK